ncbi:MAG TPA: hypothetical protein VGA92_07260, partial [Candidatus Nitrosotenuis sp.]
LGKDLDDVFGLKIINDRKWKELAEIFYRRHIIVHNNGRSDSKYKEKTGVEVGTDLSPELDYVTQTLDTFRYFSKLIRDFFKEKYSPVTP